MDLKLLSIVLVGTLILFNIFGYNPPISGALYQLVGNNTENSEGKLIDYTATDSRLSGIEGYNIWTILIVILAGISTIGVVVGFFTRTPPVEYLSAGFISFMGTCVLVDILWLFGKMWSFGAPYNMLGMLVFAPMIVSLIYAMYEAWRNG